MSVWFSPASGVYAVRTPTGVAVRGAVDAVDLSGALADEFLAAFCDGLPAERLEALAALGSDRHRSLHRIALAAGARPWAPLSAIDTTPTLFLEVLGRCNERCVHCYAGSSPDVSDVLDRETCLRVIAEARELGFERLQLTGGDPLLHPELPVFAAAWPHHVEVYTNGLALTPERLEALDVDFAFSFYSHDPSTHDAITRVAGSQLRTASAISAALSRGRRVRAAIIVTATNAPHVAETTRFLEALGVKDIWVDSVRQVGRGAGLTAPAIEGGANPPVGDIRAPGKLCVAYTGDVYPCIFSRTLRLGSVKAESLQTIVSRARARAKVVTQAIDSLPQRLACLDCRLTSLALGPRA